MTECLDCEFWNLCTMELCINDPELEEECEIDE